MARNAQRGYAGMVLPGVQLSERINNQQRKRGKQNINRNGLGMDETGDMSKIFGGGGNRSNAGRGPRRPNQQYQQQEQHQYQPPPPSQYVAEVNDNNRNIGAEGGGSSIGGRGGGGGARYRDFAKPKVVDLPNIRKRMPGSPTPEAPSTDLPKKPSLDNVDRAMDILVNQLDRGQDDSARVRALEQRLGFLESENADLKQYMTSQISSLMSKLAQSEDRLLSEVQQRVELELEVRSRQQSSGVAEAQSYKRIATVERLLESQQSEISTLKSNLKEANDRLMAIPDMQDRVNAAISTVHQGNSEVRGVDNDVAKIKEALRKRESEQREIIDVDNRKNAVLFGEVARLGKSIESAGAKTERALAVMQTRFESLEGRLKADERGIIAMEGRDAERFDNLVKRAEQLEKYLVELSDMSLKQRQQLDAESARRKSTQDEQGKLVSEVRSALAKTDTDVSSRLTALLTQIGEQLVAEREIHTRKLEEQKLENARSERASEERLAAERDRISKRFQALEAALREESEIRASQTQQIAKENNERSIELRSLVQQENTARTGIQKVLEETQQRVSVSTKSSVDELKKELRLKFNTLEEITRTEIKSRMSGQEKIFNTIEILKNVSTQNVGRARSEAAKMLDQSNHDIETRLKKLETTLDKSQRESLMALSRSTQSQSLLNNDLSKRLDNLEQRELKEENETEKLSIDLTNKINTFGRANQDSIGALSSVVADHRRESEEMLAKMSNQVEVELEASATTMRQAITSFSTDVMAEIEKLRESSAASIQENKDEALKLFNTIGDDISEVNKKITSNENDMNNKIKSLNDKNKKQLKDQMSHRKLMEENGNEIQIRSCINDIIATIENKTITDSIFIAQKNVDDATKQITQKAKETSELMTKKMSELSSMVETKTLSIEKDILLLKEDTSNRFNESIATAVKDTMSASVVEQAISERISLLETDMKNRIRTMEAAEKDKVERVNNTLKVINLQVQQAKEDRSRLESRVESVIGQVEEERNNSELEWQKSLTEAQRQDDIEADEPLDGFSNDGSNNETVLETGTLPTVDVGFPPPSEDLSEN